RLALPPPPPLAPPPEAFWVPFKLACPRPLDARVVPPASYPPNALLRPPVLVLSFAKPRAGSEARLAGLAAAGRFAAPGLAGWLGRLTGWLGRFDDRSLPLLKLDAFGLKAGLDAAGFMASVDGAGKFGLPRFG